MKKFILTIFLMIVTQAAIAEKNSQPPTGQLSVVHRSILIENYNAIESDSLRISMNSGLNGFIEGKVCDSCKEIKVIITPQTKAYENKVEVPLKEAESRIGRSATVIYEVKTKLVSAIRW